ncbi:MAG: SOSS complex subunit B family protein [Candidatus Woesearchaeota archaeon]|nr:SOSS complex subunit B family protein [Candidatus Woesearchaeota archaeon]
MKISELIIGQRAIIKAKISSRGDVRTFTKFGREGRVCEFMLEDDSGKIKMPIFDEAIDELVIGETVKIAGYVKEYKGEMQFNVLGRE